MNNGIIDRECFYRALFFEIIDNIQNHILNRFESFKDLEYFSLLDCSKFSQFKVNFPVKY